MGRGSGALPIVSTIISKATRGINLSIEEGFGEEKTMHRCITNVEEGQLRSYPLSFEINTYRFISDEISVMGKI